MTKSSLDPETRVRNGATECEAAPPTIIQARPARAASGTAKRVAMLQTIVLISMAFLQAKGYAQAAAVDAPQQQPSVRVINENVGMDQKWGSSHQATAATEDDGDDDEDDEESTTTSAESNDRIDSVIVATVDGSLASLDKRTGKLLWKRPGNNKQDYAVQQPHFREQAISDAPTLLEPLVSTTTTVKTPAGDWRTAAIPSIDGSVYLTAVGRETPGVAAADDVTVTTSVQELVDRAPFVDTRGRIYTGTRRSTAVAVDAATGEILQVVSADEQSPKQHNNPALQDRNVVWMGRVDHAVSIHEPRSGSLDVQFASAEILSVNDMVIGGSSHQPWEPAGENNLLLQSAEISFDGEMRLERSSAEEESVLVATPNGDVAYRNVATGKVEWVSEECFDSPVAFAVDSASGAALQVNIVPDAVMPNGDAAYVANEIERQLQLSIVADAAEEDEQTIVGSLSSGQLFAMPLGVKKDSSAGISRHPITASAASAASNSKHQHTSKVPQITGRQHSHFHHDGKPHAVLGKKPCTPGSTGFPGCLIGTRGPFARDMKGSFLSEAAPGLEENAIVPVYHPDYGYIPAGQSYFTIEQGQDRRKPDRVLRILGNWLAPTIALIFVISFELGRRKRQEKVKQELEAGEIVRVSGNGSRTTDVGVIHVCDDVILGYGGHGTVVYKGTLEGRQVAVKRMLKAYHASADREISLLIESDGHPNVVRYFLKEARGDFVYLALELCDLSLHDLIGTLRQNFEQHGKDSAAGDVIAAVTSTILFQIANGVKHLHRLRIVHRDLKPANILLAESKRTRSKRKETADNKSTFETFKLGEYAAKISDMGLGKQLAGQSSYGASMHAELHNEQSNGAQSSIAGAGPGSVGWQAPEVMALRLPSDASVRSDGSGALQDSLVEASPLDIATSGRTSRSVDIFSLGCIFYSTLVPGSHPFGEWYEREANIMHNRPNLEGLRELSLEAYDLVSAMIQRSPSARPTADQVCEHPFFWSGSRRISFLCDFSDRLETEALNPEDGDSALLTAKHLAVERNAANVVGMAWDRDLDDELTRNVQRFRTYDPSSVRDLLRLVRNKHHHFDELPVELKERMGSNTDGLIAYFHKRFPGILIHCFNVCRELFPSDDPLSTKFSIAPMYRQSARRPAVPLLPLTTHRIIEANEAVATAVEELDTIPESGVVQTPLGPPVAQAPTAVTPEKAEAAAPSVPDSSALRQPAETVETCLHQPALEYITDTVSCPAVSTDDVVVWEGSTAAKSFNCRGWSRSDNDWERCTDLTLRKRDVNLVKCAEDPKFRTRLCNHWDVSRGTFCPMRKRHKCIFAHGPVELRVKEAKRHRWGKLVDKNGDNKNPNHSGGEDTYGAARSIETMRKEEGKWKTNKAPQNRGKKQPAPAKNS